MSKEIDKLLDSNDLGAAIAVKGITDIALDTMRRETDAVIALDEASRNLKDKQEELTNVRSEQSSLRREVEARSRAQQGNQSVIMAYALEVDQLKAEKSQNEEAIRQVQENLELARRNEKTGYQLVADQKIKLKKNEEQIQRLEQMPHNLAIAYIGALRPNASLLEKFGNYSPRPQEPELDFSKMREAAKKHSPINQGERTSSELANQPGEAEQVVANQLEIAEMVAQAEGISIELAQRIIQAADRARADAMTQLAGELDDESYMKRPLQIMADIICGHASS